MAKSKTKGKRKPAVANGAAGTGAVTSGDVESLHKALADGARAATGAAPTFVNVDDGKKAVFDHWKRSKANTTLRFTACAIQPTQGTKVGGMLSRFTLGTSLKWGMNAQWEKVGDDKFSFIGTSIQVFPAEGVDHPALLRAEWDDPKNRGAEVGQPHWHIDSPFYLVADREEDPFGFLEEFQEPAAPTDDFAEVEALANTNSVAQVNLRRVHLFMGGWSHSGGQEWHHPLDPTELKRWASSVLRYLERESEKLTLAMTRQDG